MTGNTVNIQMADAPVFSGTVTAGNLTTGGSLNVTGASNLNGGANLNNQKLLISSRYYFCKFYRCSEW
ncbi:hypothetical protein IDM32_15850 [Acinetobacter seifertii]|nr:hypothetical protein [Acinetobacter seifertii]